MALPKNPVKGQIYKVRNPKTGRETCFKATGKKGFGKWKIVSCKNLEQANKMAETNPRIQTGNAWVPGIGWR